MGWAIFDAAKRSGADFFGEPIGSFVNSSLHCLYGVNVNLGEVFAVFLSAGVGVFDGKIKLLDHRCRDFLNILAVAIRAAVGYLNLLPLNHQTGELSLGFDGPDAGG